MLNGIDSYCYKKKPRKSNVIIRMKSDCGMNVHTEKHIKK